MSTLPKIPTPQQRQEMMTQLTPEERSFVQKANNAGQCVSFIPQNGSEPFLFIPTSNQIKNASISRNTTSSKSEDNISFQAIQRAKSKFKNFAVIATRDAEGIQSNQALRMAHFQSLSVEEQVAVLKSNLAGLNVTIQGSTNQTFLYMAPITDAEKQQLRAQLSHIEHRGNSAMTSIQKITQSNESHADLNMRTTNQNQ